jgi:hypothetical protein
VILLVAIVGYISGREVRETAAVDIPIADEPAAEVPALT